MDNRLPKILLEAGVGEDRISDIINSGFYIRDFMSVPGAPPWQAVSDMLYGNKTPTSVLDIDKFVQYARGIQSFGDLPGAHREKVSNFEQINEILSEPRRAHYIREGSLTFRGQPREYYLSRRVPNPLRANRTGHELSITPGLYRQQGEFYSCLPKPRQRSSFKHFAHEFETESDSMYFDFSYDLMRTEQHYATQTAGLDVAFDIETALFFATHQFSWRPDGKAFYWPIPKGSHRGIVYMFRFNSPPVKQTEFLIKDFDFFTTHRPERILRQNCGLPMFDSYERNLPVTDLDCIIELDADFDYQAKRTPEYMFPDVNNDKFYAKVLDLKDRHPKALTNVVEYAWAREAVSR